MFSEYKQYLTLLRDSLIQNGVGVDASDIDIENAIGMGDSIDSLLYFYRVISTTSSGYALRDYPIDLSSCYLSAYREVCYREFLKFLEGYKKISTSFLLDNASLGGLEEPDEEEFSLFEEPTIGGIQEYDTPIEETKNFFDAGYEYQGHGVYIEDIQELAICTCQEHGTFIEDIEEFDTPEEGTSATDGLGTQEVGYSSNGVYIEDIQESDIGYSPNGVYIEDIEEVVSTEELGTEEHGVYIDDVIILDDSPEEGIEYEDDDVFYDATSGDTEDEDDGIEYSEDSDGIEYSEDGGIEYSEEDDGIEYAEDSDDGVKYSEDEGIEYSEDSDDEIEYEEDDGIEYSEEDDGIEYPEEEDDGTGYSEDDDDGISYEIPSEGTSPQDSVEDPELQQTVENVHDLSDTLQDITTSLWYGGKKVLLKGIKRLKE